MTDVQARYEALKEKVDSLQRTTASEKIGRVVDLDRSAGGPPRRFVPLTNAEVREMLIEAYALLETQGLSDAHHDRASTWCDHFCAHAGLVNGHDVRAWLSGDLILPEEPMTDETPDQTEDEVVWDGGAQPTDGGPSRYDMTLDPDQFPDGRYDLTVITAEEIDQLIDSQGGERRLDALLAIAEDAGVAADEIEQVVKVGTQLIKQAIRAAKAAT